VGIVKLHLPVNLGTIYNNKTGASDVPPDGFVSVRILYPTLEEPKNLPYLDPDIALDYCKETIAFGAPPPLKEFGFLLHNLRLVQMPMAPNAKPLEGRKLPLVVYSHGLGGTAITYTYQTQHLAAQGHVVVVLDHTDGSAPVVQNHDGTKRTYDSTVGQVSLL
jgi:platelet-activating factor acetylhydrolase